MTLKNVCYPPTTAHQRKLLFETWEQSGNVTTSCQKAHVGRTTFYLWMPRFEKAGYARLETCEQNGVPKGTGWIAAEVEVEVLGLHEQHADRGKHRVAHEIAKANNWVSLVSPNTVRSNGIAVRFVRTLKEWWPTKHGNQIRNYWNLCTCFCRNTEYHLLSQGLLTSTDLPACC